MYSTSEAYKLAIKDSRRTSRLQATLTAGGKTTTIQDADILRDTVYVTNQCVNGSNFEYGGVYAAECGITIKTALDQYSLYDAELALSWAITLADGTEEAIPLGVFYVSEPKRINDKVSLKALDGMTKLDQPVAEDTTGTMPEIVAYIAEQCGVSMAQTAADLGTFANADVLLSVRADKIDTYRDLLAYVCMITCCFATFDRTGKLKLVEYGAAGAVTGKKQRFIGATYSDYKTTFRGVKARFIANENYAPYEESDDGNGLVLDMGDIPIIQGTPEQKHEILNAIKATLADVEYTPCEIQIIGDPSIDLGDLITSEDVGKDGREYTSIVTYSYWQYRGKHKIRSDGGNPKLANITDKTSKNIASMEAQIDAKTVGTKTYTNAADITLQDAERDLFHFQYTVTEDNKPLMLAHVQMDMAADGLVIFQTYLDNVLQDDRTVQTYVPKGPHLAVLFDHFDAKEASRNTVRVTAKTAFYASVERSQQARIATQDNFLAAIAATPPTVVDNVVVFPAYAQVEADTSIPTATIAAGGIKAALFAQGVATGGSWDGTISFTEALGNVSFDGRMTFTPFDDSVQNVSVQLQTPMGARISEQLGTVAFSGGLSFRGVTAYVNVGEVILDYIFCVARSAGYTYSRYVATDNDAFTLRSQYITESTEQDIDSGRMCSVLLDTTGIIPESMEVVQNG